MGNLHATASVLRQTGTYIYLTVRTESFVFESYVEMMIGFFKNNFVTCLLLLGFGRTFSLKVNKNNAPELNAPNIGRALLQCLNQNKKFECIKIKVMHILEEALHDNSTWHYGDFVLVEKNKLHNQTNRWSAQQQQRSISDRIGVKLLQLAQTRSIRLKIPERIDLSNLQSLGASFSDAVDDIKADINTVVGTTADNNVVEVVADNDVGVGDSIKSADEGRKKKHNTNKKNIWYLYHPKQKTRKGRKKKDKDKNLAMMGGMTVLAMMAQMFFGKVILLAGASFVLAKIALLISLLTSIKSKTSGGHGSEHVIVTGGSGHGHESLGWHRSMPYDYTKLEVLPDDEPQAATHHIESDHGSSHDEYGPPTHNDHGYSSSNSHHDSGFYSHKFSDHDTEDEFDRRAGFLKI